MSIRSRTLAFAAAAVLALTATAAQAQSLTGAWIGAAMGVVFRLTVQPNGAYIETQTKGRMRTQQSGAVVPSGRGLVTFTVVNWAPRTMPLYHPAGTVGGATVQRTVAKPSGGAWRLVFHGPSSFTLTDVHLGGSVTFKRAG